MTTTGVSRLSSPAYPGRLLFQSTARRHGPRNVQRTRNMQTLPLYSAVARDHRMWPPILSAATHLTWTAQPAAGVGPGYSLPLRCPECRSLCPLPTLGETNPCICPRGGLAPPPSAFWGPHQDRARGRPTKVSKAALRLRKLLFSHTETGYPPK